MDERFSAVLRVSGAPVGEVGRQQFAQTPTGVPERGAETRGMLLYSRG